MLFAYLMRTSGDYDLAGDIMQESFTRYLDKYSDRGAQPALLFTISRNLLFDHSRKNRAVIEYDDNLQVEQSDQEEKYLQREQSQLVLAAIQQLEEDERDILSMIAAGGLSYRQVAEIVNTSEGNIKVKVHRARVKLRQILQEEEIWKTI
jgi:RNA polymerase sigma-70 factor (ECF subfamily)